MSDDLVKRLRGWAKDIQEGSTAIWAMDQDLKEAADRIEELELAVKYEADLAQQALDSMKELEAKLEKAVKALEFIALNFNKPDKGLTDFGERQHYLFVACRLRDKARTTLAELKGETDE